MVPVLGRRFAEPNREFRYQFGAHVFTIDDIKHGILRKNSPAPYKTKSYATLASNDERLKYVCERDKRVILLFREEQAFPKPLIYFAEETCDQLLDRLCK
jgi:hypothetical protein